MQTPIAPGATSAGPIALLTFPPSNNDPPPSPTAKEPLPFNMVIGTLDFRTPAEDIEFQECEAVVRESLGHLARVGEALIRIRDKQLYKNEYHSFETYCSERWGFGHTKRWRYIYAAQVHAILAMVSGVPLPECEAQIRPLIGLPAELAQQAWTEALGCSSKGYVPARLVKRAVKHLLKTAEPARADELNAHKQQRYRIRQTVRAGFQDLLTLLLGSTHRDVLIAKVQEIQRLLDPILNPKKTSR